MHNKASEKSNSSTYSEPQYEYKAFLEACVLKIDETETNYESHPCMFSKSFHQCSIEQYFAHLSRFDFPVLHFQSLLEYYQQDDYFMDHIRKCLVNGFCKGLCQGHPSQYLNEIPRTEFPSTFLDRLRNNALTEIRKNFLPFIREMLPKPHGQKVDLFQDRNTILHGEKLFTFFEVTHPLELELINTIVQDEKQMAREYHCMLLSEFTKIQQTGLSPMENDECLNMLNKAMEATTVASKVSSQQPSSKLFCKDILLNGDLLKNIQDIVYSYEGSNAGKHKLEIRTFPVNYSRYLQQLILELLHHEKKQEAAFMIDYSLQRNPLSLFFRFEKIKLLKYLQDYDAVFDEIHVAFRLSYLPEHLTACYIFFADYFANCNKYEVAVACLLKSFLYVVSDEAVRSLQEFVASKHICPKSNVFLYHVSLEIISQAQKYLAQQTNLNHLYNQSIKQSKILIDDSTWRWCDHTLRVFGKKETKRCRSRVRHDAPVYIPMDANEQVIRSYESLATKYAKLKLHCKEKEVYNALFNITHNRKYNQLYQQCNKNTIKNTWL